MTTSWSMVLLQLVVAANAILGLDKIGANSRNVAELQRQRWREKLPDVGIPQTLAVCLSPLSLAQLQNFAMGLKKMDATSFNANEFCSSAGLLCRETVLYHPVKRYGRLKGKIEEDKKHLFLDREELRESGEIILPDLGPTITLKSFLPSELAEMMPPLSTANVSQILKLLNITSGSNMSRNMVSTLEMCEQTVEEGEVRSCSTSIEGMLEFVGSLLGSDVDLLSDPSVEGSNQRVTVSKAAKRENIMGSKPPITCHNFVFPYGVTYCHSINGSKVFDLQLEVVQDDKKITRNATALCHYFSHGTGGNQASCHVIYGEMLLWMPKPKRE